MAAPDRGRAGAVDRWRWFRRLAPWVIAGSAIVALLIQYPADRIAAELARGDALAMVPAAAAVIAALWFTATTSDFLIFPPVVGPVRFFDLFRSKAGVSLLNALGPAINFGGYAVWIKRRFDIHAGAAAGLVMMVALSDLCSVTIIAGVTLWTAERLAGPARDLPYLVPAVGVVALTALLVRPGAGRRHLLDAWRRVPRRARLLGVAARCANIGVLVIGTWAAARGFGMPLPLSAVATALPVLLVIGAMPVNVAGLGPIQAAWVAMFSPWASGEQILAFQVLWHVLLLAAAIARGAPFLRRVVADVARPSPT